MKTFFVLVGILVSLALTMALVSGASPCPGAGAYLRCEMDAQEALWWCGVQCYEGCSSSTCYENCDIGCFGDYGDAIDDCESAFGLCFE